MTNLTILQTATSYPDFGDGWQGIFIKNLVNAQADLENFNLKLWAPDGPRSVKIDYIVNDQDKAWLTEMLNSGGIAALLRTNLISGLATGIKLLRKQRAAIAQSIDSCDIVHINWLQNALAYPKCGKPMVVSALGTDIQLLEKPLVTQMLRRQFRRQKTVITPNAEWMKTVLENKFGDICQVHTVRFGIDEMWYDIKREMSETPIWLVVSRLTRNKIGPLFEWGERLFKANNHQLHFFGPMQEQIELPDWVHYHGSATPQQLCMEWFPKARGLITLSAHAEGRPQVMLEAMASGLPIIASKLMAHEDFVHHKVNGYIVNSPDEFSLAVDKLLVDTENQAISNSNRDFARKHYGTWRDCALRYLDMYRGLLQ